MQYLNEFNAKAVRSESATTVTFDVRPFADRQAEAIESYLHGRLMNLQVGVGEFGTRTITLLCAPGTRLSSTGSG